MVDSDSSSDNYKVSKTSICAIMKDLGMLKIVPDGLKTNEMCKTAVKKLLFVMLYVPD